MINISKGRGKLLGTLVLFLTGTCSWLIKLNGPSIPMRRQVYPIWHRPLSLLILVKVGLVLLLPFLVINSQALLSIHIPANGLSNQGSVLVFLAPSLEFRIALGGINLHVLVASKGMDRGSGHKGQRTSHDNHDGIGRGIGEPSFSEGVGILFEGLLFGLGLDVQEE